MYEIGPKIETGSHTYDLDHETIYEARPQKVTKPSHGLIHSWTHFLNHSLFMAYFIRGFMAIFRQAVKSCMYSDFLVLFI